MSHPAVTLPVVPDLSTPCPLCAQASASDSPALAGNEHALVIADGFPCAPGHLLVIPRRHVGHLAELTPEEADALWHLALDQLRRRAGSDTTVGVNDGPAAGQTVPHVHLHLIPRTWGDHPDPRGGVRWVLPEHAQYWADR